MKTAAPKSKFAWVVLGALGVVFGDIGTSPLYALRECFHGHGLPATPDNIFGVLSLVFWALVIVVSLKYMVLVLRADNNGEGGILALLALVQPDKKIHSPIVRHWFILMGLFGAALLYGDSMITPSISVLSAVEGLKLVTPMFDHYVLPITMAILFLLFSLQRIGTGPLGGMFGPIIVIWFTVLAVLGISGIAHYPSVLWAINPQYAIHFFASEGYLAFQILGAVFLVLTGAEALYADMGHFGRKPIRAGWFMLAFPSIMLNYFGQGALLVEHPEAVVNPFFFLAPQWAILPLVLLATVTTVIASQAVISGAFSLTYQAVQLGYLPRIEIRHTSPDEKGQIFVPAMNWALFVATLWLVTTFGSSSNLAAAYGIAVSTTMVITTLLIGFLAHRVWNWPLYKVLGIFGTLFLMDLAFLGSNLTKIFHGGWFPLVVGGSVLLLMATWRTGRRILAHYMAANAVPYEKLFERMDAQPPKKVPGTAVFMASDMSVAPAALVHNLRHNKCIHDRVLVIRIATRDVPHIPFGNRVSVRRLKDDFFCVLAEYGFNDRPNVPQILRQLGSVGIPISLPEVTFFLGRETILASSHKAGMAIWREHLFAMMSRNAQRATAFFQIPPDQVIEIGLQIEI
ncbi:potassium transporter Kup [bacterium]|nr:potassium transporter Kup [bacterium]